VACLEIFTSRSADQPPEDAHDPPVVWPPTPAVRTKRAIRSAPVVLVRGVRMPAYAETGASVVMQHGLPKLPSPGYGPPGAHARQVALALALSCLRARSTTGARAALAG
jgi:hypothetical protein